MKYFIEILNETDSILRASPKEYTDLSIALAQANTDLESYSRGSYALILNENNQIVDEVIR